MMREKTKNRTMNAKHYSGDVSREIHLERIQEKLDWYSRGKRTAEEFEKFREDEQAEFQRNFASGLGGDLSRRRE